MDGPFADADTSCETVINSYQIYHNYNAELQTPYTLFGPSSSFHRIEMEKVNLENHSIKNDHAMINNESLLRGPDTHIRIDDEDFSIGSVTENGAFILNQNVQNNVPVDYVPKDTFSDTDSLLNNQHENRSLHSDQNEVNSDDKSDELKGCSLKDVVKTDSSREESKHSEPEPKPSLTSFLSMENSNNAIDNNFHNEIISENSIPIVVSGCNYAVNHIFKLPKNDLTFNGTLKRLKNLNPIKNSIDTDIGYTAIGNDCNSEINNSKLDCNTYNETMEISKNDTPQTSFHLSSEELSKPLLEGDHLNLETSNKHIGILSPKETDDRLDNVSSPKDNDTTLKDMEKTYVNSSKESLNNSFDSGAHSPELFSFEDDISEPVCLKMKFIMKQFEKSDNTIIKKLEV